MSGFALRDAAPEPADQYVVLHGVSWARYQLARELFDGGGVRMAYFKGALEIMSPSSRHEFLKKAIARLIEVFALERDVPLMGYGSTTFKSEYAERGLEPDECYCVGHELRDVPDVAIEVVLTSGGLDKLAIYAGLGVREVWMWRSERFELHALQGERYVVVDLSAVVPGIDFEQLASFVRQSNQHAAAKGYRDALRAG